MKLSAISPFSYFDSAKHTSGLGSRLRAANKRQQFKDSQTTVSVLQAHKSPLKGTVSYARCQIHAITPASLEAKTKEQYIKQAEIMFDLLLHRLKKSDAKGVKKVRENLKTFKAQFISGSKTDTKALEALLRISNALESSYVSDFPKETKDRRHDSYAQELVRALAMCGLNIDISAPSNQAPHVVKSPRPTTPAPALPRDEVSIRVEAWCSHLVAGLSSGDQKMGIRAVNSFFSSYGNEAYKVERDRIVTLLEPKQQDRLQTIRWYIDYAKANLMPNPSHGLDHDQIKYLVLVKAALNTSNVQ